MKKIQVKPAISTITRKFDSKKSKGTKKTPKNEPVKEKEVRVPSTVKQNARVESIFLEVEKEYNSFTKDPIERPPSYQCHVEHEATGVDRKGSVRGLWQEFRSGTTMHGLKHASQIKTYKLRGCQNFDGSVVTKRTMKKIQVKPAISTITRKFDSKKSKGTKKTPKNEPVKEKEVRVPSTVKQNARVESIFLEVEKEYNSFTKDPIERPPSYQCHVEHEATGVDRKGSVRGLWQEFRSGTTMHGLKHASQIKTYKLRGTIWAIALCLMLSLLIFTTYDLLCKYLQKSTISNIKMEIVDELPFPSITFCNLSPYKKSALPQDPRIHQYFLLTSRVRELLPNINYSDPFWDILNEPITEDWLQEVSFTTEDLFAYCVGLNDIQIGCSDSVVPKVTSWGRCYTFNDYDQVLKNGPMMTTATGSAAALTMYMKVDQTEYVHNKNLAAGMKIIIHDPEEEPDVENKGFFASPGFSSYASIKFSKHKYLPYPYQSIGGGYCLDTKSSDFKNPLQYHERYSRTACLLECRLRFLISKCGCKSPTDFGNFTICSLAELDYCYTEWKENYMRDKILQAKCKCPQPCEYNVYSATVSTGYYTAAVYNSLLEQMGFHNLRQNYLEVRLFFDNLSYLKVENIAEYSLEKIVRFYIRSTAKVIYGREKLRKKEKPGSLGGQMGIFLGASLLTLSELIEFFILAGLVLCKNIIKRRENRK